MEDLQKELIQKSIPVYCAAKGITKTELARKIQVSPGTISNIINGKWNIVSDHMLRLVSNEVNPTALSGLIKTSDHANVNKWLETAVNERLMVAVLGNTGLGKTTLCEAFRLRPEVFYYRYTHGDSPKKLITDLLKEICTNYEGTMSQMLDRLCGEINVMSSPVIIIDECSKLNDKMLMLLHSVRDNTQHNCGIVLVGMPFFKNYLIKQVNKDVNGFAEFYRRINQWHEMEGLTADEITFILNHNGITDKEAQRQFKREKSFGYLMNAIRQYKQENN